MSTELKDALEEILIVPVRKGLQICIPWRSQRVRVDLALGLGSEFGGIALIQSLMLIRAGFNTRSPDHRPSALVFSGIA